MDVLDGLISAGIVVLVLYLIFAALVFWILTNNIFIWRSKDYSLPFENVKKGWLPEGIRYWICYNPAQVEERWALMLHSWGRNSARMVDRSLIYWERGYSLVFVDAWSHGQSKYKRTSTALWFAQHSHKVVEKEGIPPPVVHGLSFGSIAATIYAANYPTKAVVAEALMNNVREMMIGFLEYMNIPIFLFGWEVTVLLHTNFPWHLVNPSNNLPLIKAPIFLIHGSEDRMFRKEVHFAKNVNLLKESDRSWVVEGSPHSKMFQFPGYREKLEDFLDDVESD